MTSSKRTGGIFDGLPISAEKSYLREDILRIDESWIAARFDSLPHVVHILTSKDREGEIQYLREQSDIIEEVVDEVVHAYHSGFNKAIQNYSQILRLFSESAESISVLKVDLAEAKKLLGSRNKELHQLWYRSMTLRHIISLLNQIDDVSKVPIRIEKLIAEKQLYAAIQLHVHSTLMLEREGLQAVGALQDVRSELIKLRGVLFFKVLEDLHNHLYNKGEYSSVSTSIGDVADEIPTTTYMAFSPNASQSISRRTRSVKGDQQFSSSGTGDVSHRPDSVDESSSIDGRDEELSSQVNGSDGHLKDIKIYQTPMWLSSAAPNEFLENMKKSDAPLHVKYLKTLVECLHMLGKISAAGAMLCQRLRPTLHEIITIKVKAQAAFSASLGSCHGSKTTIRYTKGSLESYQNLKPKRQNGTSLSLSSLTASPVSVLMAPMGAAQVAASELLHTILDALVRILANHITVCELLESKSERQSEISPPKSVNGDSNWYSDPETSQVTGGYNVGFCLMVVQSECQQLICEILRATLEATSAEASVQTARLANKTPSKEKREGLEDGLSFAFRFTDTKALVPGQGADLIRQGYNRRATTVLQEGYGTAVALPEQGIYLAASVYRPVIQFTDKVASLLPQKYSQFGNDGLLAFVENFLKDHLLPTMFVDYRKSVQQAISSPAAFRPRARPASTYSSSIEKGRPVLQSLLAIDFLAREVLDWARAMPKYAVELVEYVQTFLERTYERCRTAYMEAVLEKQSYMLIGRTDVEHLMRLDPADSYIRCSSGQQVQDNCNSDSEALKIENEMSDLLLQLQPIKQENLIHDDHKLILLASLSDSLEYVAESIERLGQVSLGKTEREEISHVHRVHHSRSGSALSKNLDSIAAEYRRLSVDCLKVLRVEMQLETIFHMQEMNGREYLDNQDAEEPDDFIISLTAQIIHRDEEISPFVAESIRNYIFGGICSVAANISLKALSTMKSINLFGVQQICRNSIALEQALSAIPSINSVAVQQRFDQVRAYYELLNLPFEALLAFITEHEYLFTLAEYSSLLKVNFPGRDIPSNAEARILETIIG